MTKQQVMILQWFETRALDSSLPKALRDFNRKQAREYADRLKEQDRPKPEPPAAFTKFLNYEPD